MMMTCVPRKISWAGYFDDVLNQPPHPWREESWVPYDQRILEMDWREVERQFLVRFRQLSEART